MEDIGVEAEMEGVGSNTKDEELVEDIWQWVREMKGRVAGKGDG